MFKAKIRKNVYPYKPQFYYIKVGCKGYKSYGPVIMIYFVKTTRYGPGLGVENCIMITIIILCWRSYFREFRTLLLPFICRENAVFFYTQRISDGILFYFQCSGFHTHIYVKILIEAVCFRYF